jgi:hypothetical protein
MESHRVREDHRTIVPHRLVVRLAPQDLTALRAASPTLAADLADAALAFARAHAFTLLDRPTVTLRGDSDVEPGDVEVDALDVHPAAVAGSVGPAGAGSAMASGHPVFPAAAGAGGAAASGVAGGGLAGAENTAVFVVPGAEGPRATIREIRPDRSSRTIAFDGRPLTIGRAPENGLVVRDGRASRQHARIDVRRGSLVLTDLRSTNGSWVNDRRVESIALGEGDQVRIGMTTLIIEAVEPVARATRSHAPPAAQDAAAAAAGASAEQDRTGIDPGHSGAREEAAGSRSDRPAPV